MYSYNVLIHTNCNVIITECTVEGQNKVDCAIDERCAYTCDNRNNSIHCPFRCVVRGCQCPEGTVINELINKCVELSMCPSSRFISICTWYIAMHTYNY